MAKGANPLTGLPGNVAIEQEINRRARVKTPSSLIYIDLDNFKVYNDVYGFENGDKVILFTSQVLVDVLKDEGSQTDFLGHVGGDDFVIISEQGSAERICKAIIDKFEKQASKLYNQEDRKRGFIFGKGRDGVEREFSLISVSIGIVDCEFKCSFTMDEMSHRVAEVKKYSKSIPGNSYVKDRRSPLGCGPIGIVRPIK
jgi:diguanylate cyclase (GGDEF)-like protein